MKLDTSASDLILSHLSPKFYLPYQETLMVLGRKSLLSAPRLISQQDPCSPNNEHRESSTVSGKHKDRRRRNTNTLIIQSVHLVQSVDVQGL